MGPNHLSAPFPKHPILIFLLGAILNLLANSICFAEADTSVAATLTGSFTPGSRGTFSFSSITGPAGTSAGNFSYTYSGVVAFNPTFTSGRYTSTATKYGIAFDSFQLFQSLLNPLYFTTVSSNTTCPTTDKDLSFNWLLSRARSPEEPYEGMNGNSPNVVSGGVITYNSGAPNLLTGGSSFDLATLTNNVSPGYSMNGDGCAKAKFTTYYSGKTPLDKYGTIYFGNDLIVYVSIHGDNPLVALGVPQIPLTSARLNDRKGYVYSGLLTSFTSINAQNQHNVYAAPDNTDGNIFTIYNVDALNDPTSRTSYATIDCTRSSGVYGLNKPDTGFAACLMSLTGQIGTGNVVCEFGDTGTQKVFACTGQNPSNNSEIMSVIGTTPTVTVISVATPYVTANPHSAAAATATIQNLGGMPANSMTSSNGAGNILKAPWVDPGAFPPSHGGSCTGTLNGFSSCNVIIPYQTKRKGIDSATYKVSYYNGATSPNATSRLLGLSGVSRVTVKPTKGTFKIGTSRKFKAVAHFTSGGKQNITDLVDWKSDDNSIATVNASGMVSFVGAGSTQLTARIGGFTSNPVLISTVKK